MKLNWRPAREICILTVCSLAASSCNNSTRPDGADVSQHCGVMLTVHEEQIGQCSPFPSFRIDPCRLDHAGFAGGAKEIRWDYTDDGHWDTTFGPIKIVDGLHLYPLPARVWIARYELRDADGASQVRTVSIPMPSWVPITPDVVAGPRAHILETKTNGASTDTLVSGRGFYACAERRDWLTPERRPIPWLGCYIDGALVAETMGSVGPPSPDACTYHCVWVAAGIAEIGSHTVTIVFDSRNEIAETNEDNNSVACEVFVVGE